MSGRPCKARQHECLIVWPYASKGLGPASIDTALNGKCSDAVWFSMSGIQRRNRLGTWIFKEEHVKTGHSCRCSITNFRSCCSDRILYTATQTFGRRTLPKLCIKKKLIFPLSSRHDSSLGGQTLSSFNVRKGLLTCVKIHSRGVKIHS